MPARKSAVKRVAAKKTSAKKAGKKAAKKAAGTVAKKAAGTPARRVARSTSIRLLVKTRTETSVAAVVDLISTIADVRASVKPLYASGNARKQTEFLVLYPVSADEDNSNAFAFELAHSLRDASNGALSWVEPDIQQNPSVAFDEPGDQDITGADAGGIVGKLCNENATPPADHYWHLREMRVAQAWDFAKSNGAASRGMGVRVGHLDTGWTEHPDLFPSLDFNGQHDFVDDDEIARDEMADGNPFHGSRTGSVIASAFTGDIPPATAPFSGDLSGVAPLAKIVPIRVVKSVMVFFNGNVAQGIRHAADNNCHVISMSLGGAPGNALHDAIKFAVAKNVIVCAAAGNCVKTVVWPARYSETIAVAGTNSSNRPWKGSCRGSAVDIAAPAAQVWTAAKPTATEPRPVAQGEGTSFAVAGVAGVAALWLAHHGRDALLAQYEDTNISLHYVFRHIIKQTARNINLPKGDFGAGFIDAAAVLACPLPSSAVMANEIAMGEESATPEAQMAGLLEPAPALIRTMATAGIRSAQTAAERDLLAQEFAQICLDHPNAHNAFRQGLVLAGANIDMGGDPSELLEAQGIAKYASSRLRSKLVQR